MLQIYCVHYASKIISNFAIFTVVFINYIYTVYCSVILLLGANVMFYIDFLEALNYILKCI